MLGLVWSTKLTGKQTSTLWVLFVAALGLIFVNPKLLLSISFHLSLLSTFGLVSMESYVRRALKLLFGSLPQKIPLLNLEEVLSQTLAAQILVVPYIMWVFGEFSPYGVLTNVLVSGVVFPLTVGGGISVALYLLFPELGMMVAYFVELLAEYLILVAKFFS
jgi:competence protein ComEC